MKDLDYQWIKSQAGDTTTLTWLDKIFEWRKFTMETNEFIKDETRFQLRLSGLILNFKASSAFSTIETYQEIFKDNNHYIMSEFIPHNNFLILDIGANQGFYSLRAKTYAPNCQIIAYEPNPFEYEMLCNNITSNGIKNCESENSALAGEAKTIVLEIVPEIGPIGGKTVKIPQRKWLKDSFIKRIEVKALTLDDVFKKRNIKHLDILKLDVEGNELEILENSNMLHLIDRIVLEYHSASQRSGLVDLLGRENFSMILEDRSPSDYYGDLYFVREK